MAARIRDIIIGDEGVLMSVSRRRFLESTALAGAGALLGADIDAKTGMPTRVLGRTGARVSLLAFGCGSRFLQYKDPEKAAQALNRAYENGITYYDSSDDYGDGESERRLGAAMKSRQGKVWIATKVSKRNGDLAMRLIERSLKNLGHIDLIHVHSLTNDDDLAAIEAPDGVLKVLYKLRDQKVVRAIGVTSHTDPVVLRKALERNDFDCTQMALNAARMGNASGARPLAPSVDSFENIALPVAVKKNMGVTAMKIFGQEKLSNAAPAEDLIRYSMSLPVAAAVIGMPKLEHIDRNAAVAKSFKPMPADEMRRMSTGIAREYKASLDTFFRDHIDC
jgi:aryl-alcohol dehydrogenase-like predicted oxidoreductase